MNRNSLLAQFTSTLGIPPQIAVNKGGAIPGIDRIPTSHSRLLPFVVMYLEISVTCQITQPKEVVMKVPYFSIDNARVIYTKRSKFVKNEHARYTLEIWNLKNLERLITAISQARF